MLHPIPDRALTHCVALFESPENCTGAFLEALQRRSPGVDVSQANWESIAEPRPMAYGPIECDGWRWQIVLDLRGLIPQVREVLECGARTDDIVRLVEEHTMCALIFLIDAPAEAQPLDHLRALCRVGWSYLDAGAAAIAFPEGRTVWDRKQLLELDPNEIDGTYAHIFVSSQFAGRSAAAHRWARTFGMHQFGLSDVACEICDESEQQQHLKDAEQLMSLLPPYLVELGEDIADGDTIEIDNLVWRAATSPAGEAIPAGVSVYTLDKPVVA